MPYLNLDDGFSEHPEIDQLSDSVYRSLLRDICAWSKTGETSSDSVRELLARKMVRRAPRHWLPDALLTPPRRYRIKIPTSVRRQVFAHDGYACRICNTAKNLTLDHIMPWSIGGSDDASNLQTLCQPCNSRKGARA